MQRLHEERGESRSSKTASLGRASAWAWPALGVLILVTIAVVCFAWPAWMNTFDEEHRVTLRCEVDGASTYAGSTSSRAGIGAPFSYIRVDTKNCGTLVLDGVARSERKAVAAVMSRGGEYEFQVGQGSYWSRNALAIIHRYPTAYSYRDVS